MIKPKILCKQCNCEVVEKKIHYECPNGCRNISVKIIYADVENEPGV